MGLGLIRLKSLNSVQLFQRTIFCGSLLGALVSSGGLVAQNKVLEALERGEVLSTKTASTVLVQAIVKKDTAAIQEIIDADLSQIPQIFENVATARPFVTSDKKNLLYLKLRGLTDGLSVLMEVKEGSREAFVNARELLKSADFNSREAAKAELIGIGEDAVANEIDVINGQQEAQRMLGVGSVMLLEGPLNRVEAMPDLRLTLQISFSPYTLIEPVKGEAGAAVPKTSNMTFMQIAAAFGRQVPKGAGELGDYRGFADKRLDLVRGLGESIAKSIKGRLEKL